MIHSLEQLDYLYRLDGDQDAINHLPSELKPFYEALINEARGLMKEHNCATIGTLQKELKRKWFAKLKSEDRFAENELIGGCNELRESDTEYMRALGKQKIRTFLRHMPSAWIEVGSGFATTPLNSNWLMFTQELKHACNPRRAPFQGINCSHPDFATISKVMTTVILNLFPKNNKECYPRDGKDVPSIYDSLWMDTTPVEQFRKQWQPRLDCIIAAAEWIVANNLQWGNQKEFDKIDIKLEHFLRKRKYTDPKDTTAWIKWLRNNDGTHQPIAKTVKDEARSYFNINMKWFTVAMAQAFLTAVVGVVALPTKGAAAMTIVPFGGLILFMLLSLVVKVVKSLWRVFNHTRNHVNHHSRYAAKRALLEYDENWYDKLCRLLGEIIHKLRIKNQSNKPTNQV